jgi:hypothetical protein
MRLFLGFFLALFAVNLQARRVFLTRLLTNHPGDNQIVTIL